MNYVFFMTIFLTAFLIYLIYALVDDFVVGTEKTRSSMSITIPVKTSCSETMKDVSRFIVSQNNLRIDYYNPKTYHIVLNQRMSFQRFGFLYSITISDNQGKSNVVIGISSKFPAFGPWAGKNVKMQLVGFVNAVRANLYSLSRLDD